MLAPILPGGTVVRCEPLDGGGGGAVGRKAAGYARTWRLSVRDGSGRLHELVFRTQGSDEFGHDRRADRIANTVLAFDTFRTIPDHVVALDLGLAADGDLVSLRGAGEPYLVTSFSEGTLYAEDLRHLAVERIASALDLERCDALARWLAALHEERIDDPVAWRRAVRDLLGAGEGIFGVVDAYGPEVAAAPLDRLARLEAGCLEWRWRLRGQPERLRRTHGDFHPFNLVFSGGTRFVALDASRGCKGDPADDAAALSVNYLFFALQEPAASQRGFRPLWRRFWDAYLDAAGGATVLESVAPFLAWRALVLGCPRFYPDLLPGARDALLGFAERALAAQTFDPRSAEDAFP